MLINSLCVDSARVLWALFCFRFAIKLFNDKEGKEKMNGMGEIWRQTRRRGKQTDRDSE